MMKGRHLWLWLVLNDILPALAFVASGRRSSRCPLTYFVGRTAGGCQRQTAATFSQQQREPRTERRPRWFVSRCYYFNRRRGDTNNDDAFHSENKNNQNVLIDPVLQSRLDELKLQTLEATYRMPPNPNWSAVETVVGVLQALRSCDDPTPDAGIRSLLRASTLYWKQILYKSVGALLHHRQHHRRSTSNISRTNKSFSREEAHVVAALRSSMGRPDNQFRILVEDDEEEEDPYHIVFPSEPVDYMDGTCWVECQLRRKADDALLITTGWQMQRDHENGCWMIDRIDWQDFREKFRPGVGREEWMRICG